MAESSSDHATGKGRVEELMRAAGLGIDENRLDDLAALFESALAAAAHLDEPAGRVPLIEALPTYDPTWTEEGSRS